DFATIQSLGAQHRHEVEIWLVTPTRGQLTAVARHGGSGRLEDYGHDSTLNDSIHQRNLAVCAAAKLAYLKALDDYTGWINGDEANSEDAIREKGRPPEVYL